MHRFFVSPEAFASHPVVLTGDQAHQIRRVLRLRLGERVTLLDGQGFAYEAILIALGETDAKLQVVKRWAVTSEPRTHITLLQAVLKGDNFTWALQKGTEVGVSRFVPTICSRTWWMTWTRPRGSVCYGGAVIEEAAEQRGRGRVWSLPPAGSASAPGAPTRLRRGVAADRLGRRTGDSAARRPAGCNFTHGASIEVFIGPEGGFTEEEVASAHRYGIQPVTLVLHLVCGIRPAWWRRR